MMTILNRRDDGFEMLLARPQEPDRSLCAAKHLSRQDVREIEEALQADDLEVMVSAVDAIVGRHLRSTRKKVAR